MFEPTQRNVDHDVEQSMQMFERARVGQIASIEPQRPRRILLALDGSSQDALSIALAERLCRQLKCELAVVDARETPDVADLAAGVAAQLDGTPLPKPSGDSFQQILDAVKAVAAEMAIVPCPFGRELDTVGPDSTGTVIDVLLSRCPAAILAVRKPFTPPDDVFRRVNYVLIGENEADRLAAQYAVGLVAPGGHLQLYLVLEEEFYENVRELLQVIDPKVDVSPERLTEAMTATHVRLHRGLQKSAAEHDFRYDLHVVQEGELDPATLEGEQFHPLIVVALERTDHSSQGHVRDRIRRSPNPVLIVHCE